MIFIETILPGAYLIEIEPIPDERGFFSRTWCKKIFKENGIISDFVQCNLSHNVKKGTIRGMHYQKEPYEEAKLVSCIKGAIYDVIIDLRLNSKTFKQWVAITLSEENKKILYIPEGFAHGFQTLQNETTVFYQMGEYFNPGFSRGIRYNDPMFNIKWPIHNSIIISEKDRSYKDFL